MTADGDYSAHFARIRSLSRAGDNAGAIEVADAVLARSTDPLITSRALIHKLGRLYNLGHIDECTSVLDQAFDLLTDRSAPLLRGHLHALAAIIAAPGSLERCIRHLVQAARELEEIRDPDEDTVSAWHDLAVTYSFMGFHAQAMAVAESGYLAGQALGLPRGDHGLPEVAVRWAVSLDHSGDEQGCVNMLRRTLDTWARRAAPEDLWAAEQHYYAYAAVRLGALGGDCDTDAELFAAEEHGWEVADLRLLGEACVAIAQQRPADALELLDTRAVAPYTLGPAESLRLKALAHTSMGDYRAALRADREAHRLASADMRQLRDRLVDGTRAQLDHEALRRTVEQYASEALTDPLTGLPNRRHFDRHIAQLAERGASAMVGIVDLDGFKAVNTVYGHLSGDLVLQRVAAILARSVRQGDFVARYGGDEFIVVLPDTTFEEAHRIGSRLTEAVANGEWHALVTETPVSVTIGWAELSDPNRLGATLQQADQQMLGQKRLASSV